MIGRHFHANMKVQTATCKDNNNSKSRAVTCVKFEINIIHPLDRTETTIIFIWSGKVILGEAKPTGKVSYFVSCRYSNLSLRPK